MFKPWALVVSAFCGGLLAQGMLDRFIGDVASGAGASVPSADRAARADPVLDAGRAVHGLGVMPAVQGRPATAALEGDGRAAPNAGRASAPEFAATRLTAGLPAPHDTGAPIARAYGAAAALPDADIEDPQAAFPALGPSLLELADERERASEDERILAEAARTDWEHPLDPVADTMPSEADLERERIELERQFESESTTANDASPLEEALPE